jgi:16S rRNA (guanine966-N2)-methyltransferase
VEQDARAARTIRENLATTGLSSAGTVVQTAVETFLAGPEQGAYDIVLIDPPYELGLPSHVLQSLASGGVIHGDSTVLVEASVRLSLQLPAGYVPEWERRYGDSVLLRLRLENGES